MFDIDIVAARILLQCPDSCVSFLCDRTRKCNNDKDTDFGCKKLNTNKY